MQVTKQAIRALDWRAQPGVAGAVCGGAAAALAITGMVALLALVRAPVSLESLAFLVLAIAAVGGGVVLVAITCGFFSLRYRLDPNALVILWLGARTVIPYQAIDGIFRGDKLMGVRNPRWINALGYRVGQGSPREPRATSFFTTSERQEHLSIVSSEYGVFVLSPVDPPDFRRELIARIQASGLDETPRVEASVPEPPLAIGDSTGAATAALSLLVLLVTAGVIFEQYEQLPPTLPVRFDGLGNPAWMSPKEFLFWLPGFGAAALATNGLVGSLIAKTERVLARLLWLSTPLVELLVLVSVIRLLP